MTHKQLKKKALSNPKVNKYYTLFNNEEDRFNQLRQGLEDIANKYDLMYSEVLEVFLTWE